MRILLIVLQLSIVALVYTGASFTAGSFGGGSSGGPAAVAAPLLLALQTLMLGTLFLKVVLPLMLALVSTLVCAVLAGYRFLRWLRWVGLSINLMAAAYFLFAWNGNNADISGLKTGFILFFLLNSGLFYAMPKRPDVRKSRAVIAWAHLILFMGVVFSSLLLLLRYAPEFQPPDSPGTVALIGGGLLLYALPFTLNCRATSKITLYGDCARTILPLLLSLTLIWLISLVAPLLAVPISISLFLFVGFLEMLFLYPEQYPRQPWRAWLVRLFGRLPQPSGNSANSP